MTASPALVPSTGSVPVVEAVARVHEVLDEVDMGSVGAVTGRDVAAVDRAIARMEALKLRLVAAAHRTDAGSDAGMSGTSAWLASSTRTWGPKAAADVSLATALEESLPVTRRALEAGSLSVAHAAVIAGVAGRLPGSLSEVERMRIETVLVRQAQRVDPVRLRRSARRALQAAERSAAEVDAHEDAELRGEEARAELRVRLTLHDNSDGTVTGHFTVPTLAGAILRKVIQQMTSPRRWREGTSRASAAEVVADGVGAQCAGAAATPYRGEGGEGSRSGPPASGHEVTWAQRCGAAFVELLEHLPTERLSGKVAATVVVTIDHDRLRDGLGAAHLDTGHDLSVGETRRLACSAGILPAVLGGSSLPLDLGRTHRFFSEAQRVALATMYDECAAEGCGRPYAWSELHHEDPWAGGGRTDLDLAVPLCRFHHQRMHDPRFGAEVRRGRSGLKSVVLRRRT